jgi:hypothetical protein
MEEQLEVVLGVRGLRCCATYAATIPTATGIPMPGSSAMGRGPVRNRRLGSKESTV